MLRGRAPGWAAPTRAPLPESKGLTRGVHGEGPWTANPHAARTGLTRVKPAGGWDAATQSEGGGVPRSQESLGGHAPNSSCPCATAPPGGAGLRPASYVGTVANSLRPRTTAPLGCARLSPASYAAPPPTRRPRARRRPLGARGSVPQATSPRPRLVVPLRDGAPWGRGPLAREVRRHAANSLRSCATAPPGCAGPCPASYAATFTIRRAPALRRHPRLFGLPTLGVPV